jgi:hypothetical protein
MCRSFEASNRVVNKNSRTEISVKRNQGNAIVGVILITIGIVFLLDTLNIYANDLISDYWPVLFIVMGAWEPIFKFRRPHLGNLLMIALGGLLLADKLVDDVSIGELWPVWLIIIGVSFVFGQFKRGKRRPRNQG